MKIYSGPDTDNPQKPVAAIDPAPTTDSHPAEKETATAVQETKTSTVNQTPLGEFRKHVFPVTGTVPDANESFHSPRRVFFQLKNPGGTLDLIWQDIQTKQINLTRFTRELTIRQTSTLSAGSNATLLAATNDPEGNYYYMVFQTYGDNSSRNDLITLCKANAAGQLIHKQVQNSDPSELNIFRIGHYGGTLSYQKGCLLYMQGRTMNKSSDGLNHQGGIGVAFDPETLLILRNFGQTSGHSFDNFLTTSQDGNFLGIDLGDNYPRGIHFHTFSKTDRSSQVVYTFKTHHASQAASYDGSKNYPLYKEISTPDKKFYQWSNDNATYTELGGIVEVEDGYFVIFAGEPDPSGRSLNSSRIGDNNKDPGNLGFVKIRKDFSKYSSNQWTVVPSEIMLSTGKTEKGGFYSFGGDWTPQGNAGVTWLTRYTNVDTDNVCCVKTALLPNGNLLILFGKDKKSSWTPTESYASYLMCISPDGTIVTPPTSLGNELKLSRRDEILVLNNQVIIAQGDSQTNTVQLFTLDLH